MAWFKLDNKKRKTTVGTADIKSDTKKTGKSVTQKKVPPAQKVPAKKPLASNTGNSDAKVKRASNDGAHSIESIENKELVQTDTLDSISKPDSIDIPDDKCLKRNFFDLKPIIRIIDTKLIVFLVENTVDVAKEKENVKKIVESFASSGFIYIINYGSMITHSGIIDGATFKFNDSLYMKEIGDNACLYDALIDLEGVVAQFYRYEIDDTENKRYRISSIDVIGIGTCIDNCSLNSREIANDFFCSVVDRHKVVTKYFCLTDEHFINAAAIGFRSIGAISREFMRKQE